MITEIQRGPYKVDLITRAYKFDQERTDTKTNCQFYVDYHEGEFAIIELDSFKGYFVDSIDEIKGIYNESLRKANSVVVYSFHDNDIFSKRLIYLREKYPQETYDEYEKQKRKANKFYFLPDTVEKFKKDYPYCPIEQLKDYILEKQKYNNRIKINQWGFMCIQDICMDSYLLAYMMLYKTNPQIETLYKANDWFKEIVLDYLVDSENPKYKRAFSKGNDISSITGMPNWLWNRLCFEQANIDRWDLIRVWNKQLATEKNQVIKKGNSTIYNGFDESTLEDLENLNGDIKTLKKVKFILKNSVDKDGKPYFTLKTILNYLERVDMYQAIPKYEAIEILKDYLSMCKQMDVSPRLDSDSLKREHDVTARNHNVFMRMKQEEFNKEKGNLFKEVSNKLQKYEYSDDSYIAIAPKTIKDLIEEGCNNHNCVGSYVDSFAKGKSNVFFIRKKDNPEHSYITIELTSSCENYKQAFLASNQRITNPRDWEFINNWLNHNKDINKGGNDNV